MGSVSETERIRETYARRDKAGKAEWYSFFNPSALFLLQQREKVMLRLLKDYGLHSLADKKILDVGCGTGRVLQRLVDYGASPGNLFGIDLLPDRIEKAKLLNSGIDFRCGNAEELPYGDESFDMVMQFTVFTSVLDSTMKGHIAREMLRVLKPTGAILWYDYYLDNPRNPDVRGVGKGEIHQLFPDCHIELTRLTLAAPLARALVPYSWLLAYLLEKLPFLCTHYLGVIRKREFVE